MQQFPYIAAIFVLSGIGSALVIAVDLRSCRQPMRIMNWVWILTGLWAGIFALKAYYTFGRTRRCRTAELEQNAVPGHRMPQAEPKADGMIEEGAAMRMPTHGAGAEPMAGTNTMPDMGQSADAAVMQEKMRMTGSDPMAGMEMPAKRPRWQSVVLSTLHCGAGCTLADLVGEWFLYLVPVAIGGSLLAGSWVIDYLLALVFGIGFQYAAIRGMEPHTPRNEVVRRAAKADILSLTAWQAGMYGWMAVVIFVLNDGAMLPRTSFSFWMMMQIAMACGFLVSLPVNVFLIRRGIKHGM